MRLLLSVDALTSTLTGIGRYTLELACRLPIFSFIESVRFYRHGRWISNPRDCLNLTYCPSRRILPQKMEQLWFNKLRLKMQCHGTLFHGPNYFLPSCSDIGIATIHDLSVYRFPETHPVERIKQFEKHFQATLKIADHLITDTEAIRREVIEKFSWPEDRITAVNLGTSGCFKPQTSQQLFEILARFGLVYGEYTLCVSTIEPRKKIDRLLAAYGRLPIKLSRVYPLVLVGGAGWESEGIHQQIERCFAEGWLTYLGFVAESDLLALYAGARLFVYPSIYEGFGLPVLEAMASGVPVIASCDAALIEVAGGAARHFNADDEDALQYAINEGLEDIDWRKEAVVAGIRVANQFSWDRCIEETCQVYRHVVGI
jgi:glycosyltransferase involved in cell wall biosynthesis